MNCKNVQARLSAYQDNESSIGEREEISRHLESCPSCRSEWRELQQLVTQMKMEPLSECPERFHGEIMSLLPRAPRSLHRLAYSAACTFAFLFFFTLSFLVFSPRFSPATAPLATPSEISLQSMLQESNNMQLLSIQDSTLRLIEENGHE